MTPDSALQNYAKNTDLQIFFGQSIFFAKKIPKKNLRQSEKNIYICKVK